MPLYFIRHGESTNNLQGLFTGRLDPPLTKKGEEQAKLVAEEMKSLEGIDRIISSPLGRAIRTAEIIAENLGYGRPLEIDERIVEYDLGELAGTTLRRIPSEEFSGLKTVEDPVEFRSRLTDFLDEYKTVEENIILVSHGGVYRMIESARLGLEPTEFYKVDRPKNASYIELDWLEQL